MNKIKKRSLDELYFLLANDARDLAERIKVVNKTSDEIDSALIDELEQFLADVREELYTLKTAR